MFEWIRGLRRQAAPARKLLSRGDKGDAERVELAEFAPAILPFLGLTAYLQLELYEAATRAVTGAPSLRAKNVLARVAGQTLDKHQRLTQEMLDRGHEPDTLMAPYTEVINSYVERIDTSDWHQHVLSLYLVGGLFDDFFASLAKGLKDGFRSEAISILQRETGRSELKELLEGELEADPALGSWLAVWGRRLVGDTLLVSRAALTLSDRREFDASAVEPVFTELIADHIRRMDALGLTA